MKTCACGTEIHFAITPNGIRIPLEPAGHVYQLAGDRAVPVTHLFRNHMITCPRGREFRNRRDSVGVAVDNSPLVHDLLSIVLEEPPAIDVVRSWSPEQRNEAAEWAARAQRVEDAADSRPAFMGS